MAMADGAEQAGSRRDRSRDRPARASCRGQANLPPPSAERRKQLAGQVKKLAEDTKVSVRNERRDAIKQIDTLIKDKSNSFSEDDGKISKSNIDDLTKNITSQIENLCSKTTEEVESL